MKKEFTHKRFKNRLVILFAALFGAFMLSGAYGQTIVIDSEPTGPLYVGDTIEVEYTATGFDANAVFYLYFGGDSILDSNTEVGPGALLTGVIPEGYSGSESLEIHGIVGDPDGPTEIIPIWGELNIVGSNFTYNYYDDSYMPRFSDPGIRYMELPAYDLTGDSAVVNFEYYYADFFSNPDTMSIVLEYSTDGGNNFVPIDTFEYLNQWWWFTESIGLPAVAQTNSTIMRFRQQDSNLENQAYAYEFNLGSLSIQIGTFPITEGSISLNGGTNYAIELPYTDISIIASPAGDPYNTNLYTGDSIFLEADIVGFTADTKYEVVFNTSGNIDDPVYSLTGNITKEETATPDRYLFKGLLPANIPMNQTYHFWVAPYKGAEYMHGTSFAHSFNMGGGAGNNTLEGEDGIDWNNGVYFTAGNVRRMTTNELMISGEGTITFDLARAEDKFSPSNTELVVEYSTDEGASFTKIGTIELNSLQYYNNGFTLVEMTIPDGAASDATIFRLRQNEINAENLDRFYLRSYSIMLNANRLPQGLAADYEPNDGTDYVYQPQINFLPMDISSPLYPGSSLTTDFEITVGNFPANTNIEARITDVRLPIILGSATAAETGSITGTIPTLQGNYYNVRLFATAHNGEAPSNSRDIKIEETSLEILSFVGNPDREDNGNQYFFVEDELIVDYNRIGEAIHGVDLRIRDIYGQYHTIANDNPADEQVTGLIPSGVELGSSPWIRLFLADTLFDDYSNTIIYYNNINKGFPEREVDSMIQSTGGIVDEDRWPAYDNQESFGSASTRYVQTEPFTLNYNGQLRMKLRFPANWLGWEKRVNTVAPVMIQYSTDGGTNWTTFDEVDPRDYPTYSAIPYSQTYNLPNDAISDHTMFRFIQNEDNLLGFGENIWVLEYIEVLTASTVTVSSDSEQIDLMQASLSLGTLDKTVFGPGESIVIPYNTAGNFIGDVGFAAILEYDGMEQFVIDTSSEQGLVKMNATLPVDLVESSLYQIEVFPYEKSDGQDMPILGYMEDYHDEDADYIAIEGGNRTSWYYIFNENGRRSLLTKALPQLEGDSTYFEYHLYFYEHVFPSEGVVVEVTYDGGTTFSVLDTIWDTDTYKLALATSNMTDQTHLKWTQNVNFGDGEKVWRLDNMLYKSEDNNLLTGGIDYVSYNQPVIATIDYPSMPGDFDYTSQEDVLYSGGSFDFNFNFIDGVSQFPATTEYTFYLSEGSSVVIDTNGDSVILGSLSGTGSTSFNIPSSIRKDEYQIRVTAQVEVPGADEPFIYYDKAYVTDLDVYNPLLKTIATTKEAYRGDEITVGWELQTGLVNTADYYFHLAVEDEIIYTQKDAPVNFVENLPTDITTGNRNIWVFATTDSIYKEGDTKVLDVYNDDEWVDQGNMYIWDNNYLRFNQVSAQNRLVSNTFDMTLGGKVTFDFRYDLTGNNFLESNHILFEYSDDGGETYTEIDVFPNENYELGDGHQRQTYYFAKDMLGDSTKFRFRRQNGNYGYAYIDDFILTQWSNQAPLDFVSDQVSVMSQEVDLGLLPATLCPGSSFSLDYEINGVFGEKVVHQLQYSRNGGGYSWLSDSEVYGVTEGSGSIDITIPQNFSAGDYRFRMYSSDHTTDSPFSMNSLGTENALYFVPVIDFTGTSLSGDKSLCQEGVSTYYLYSTQPYFIYQARDVATGELYGDPVSSESGGTQTLLTETITEDIELEIVVTAMAQDMSTTCATGVLDQRIEFALVQDRKLFMNDGGNWTAATDMQICEGNPQGFGLETGYYDKNGYQSSGITSITWYRDDMSTAVSSDYELYQFNQSGSYFAEVIVDGCTYITNTVQIDVLDVPEQPTFTASGDLTFCEGTSIQLTADMDYPYYRWYGGYSGNDQMSGSSQSIEIVSDGSYRLQVSNLPFEVGCASPMSEPIQVNVIEEPNTFIYRSSGGTPIEDNRYASCGGDVYLGVSSYPQTYSWTLDGETFLSSGSSNTLKATQTGWYNVRSIRQQNGVTCSFNTPDSIFVQISDELPKPTLTNTGDDEFCSENGSALLSTDAGYDGYRWIRDGRSSVTSADVVSQNSVNVEEEGTHYYTVQFVDTLGCESDVSNNIEVTVLAQPDRTASVYAVDNSLCGAQEAEIVVSNHTNYNRVLVYQLVNMATGELVGTAASRTQADGGDFVLLNAGVVTEDTEFGVMVSDLNASGCEVMIDQTEVIEVNTAEIVAVGNQLWATPGAESYQWYRNGTPLMGSTSDHIQVFDAAEYTVTVMYGFDCILTSASASMKNVTGISNILANDNITLYPNPTRDKVQIEFANSFAGDILIEVTNIAGQAIHTQQVSKHNQFMNTTIDMEQFQQGVYFFNFITEEHKIVKSVVKQ